MPRETGTMWDMADPHNEAKPDIAVAEGLLHEDRPAEAISILHRLHAAEPDNPKVFEILIDALRKERRDDEAADWGRRAVERFPGHPGLWTALGLAMADMARFAEADAAFEVVKRLDQRHMIQHGLDKHFNPMLAAEAVPALIAAAQERKPVQWSLSRYLGRCTAEALEANIEHVSSSSLGRSWPFGPSTPKKLVSQIERVPDMHLQAPTLSVMMPVFQPNLDWLTQAIEAVLQAAEIGILAEVVIVDDGASDAVRARVSDMAGRVRYHRNATQLGLLGNHNQCLSLAQGKFVHILHQDDWIMPDFYRVVLEPLRRDPVLVGAFSRVRLDSGRGQQKNEPLERSEAGPATDLGMRLLRRQRIQFASLVVRRSALRSIGGFNLDRVFAFDWDMWARLADCGPVWYDPRSLAVTRLHGQSATHGIQALERLVDILRTQFDMLMRCSKDVPRAAAARVVFSHQCTSAWASVIREFEGRETDLGQFLAQVTFGDLGWR